MGNGYQIIGSGGSGFGGGQENTELDVGDQLALGKWQRKLGCDILITGHTHVASVFERGGKLFLNPGSITGASQHYKGDCTTPIEGEGAEGEKVHRPPVTPSFMLLAIQDNNVVVFTYREIGGVRRVSQHHHQKMNV